MQISPMLLVPQFSPMLSMHVDKYLLSNKLLIMHTVRLLNGTSCGTESDCAERALKLVTC
jgi:hypothetical protein